MEGVKSDIRTNIFKQTKTIKIRGQLLRVMHKTTIQAAVTVAYIYINWSNLQISRFVQDHFTPKIGIKSLKQEQINSNKTKKTETSLINENKQTDKQEPKRTNATFWQTLSE